MSAAAGFDPARHFNPSRKLCEGFYAPSVVDGLPVPGDCKVLYRALVGYAGDKGYAWPSYKTLARKLNRSPRQTQRRVLQLEQCGLIEWRWRGRKEGGKGESNLYLFLRNPIFPQGSTGHNSTPIIPPHKERRGGNNVPGKQVRKQQQPDSPEPVLTGQDWHYDRTEQVVMTGQNCPENLVQGVLSGVLSEQDLDTPSVSACAEAGPDRAAAPLPDSPSAANPEPNQTPDPEPSFRCGTDSAPEPYVKLPDYRTPNQYELERLTLELSGYMAKPAPGDLADRLHKACSEAWGGYVQVSDVRATLTRLFNRKNIRPGERWGPKTWTWFKTAVPNDYRERRANDERMALPPAAADLGPPENLDELIEAIELPQAEPMSTPPTSPGIGYSGKPTVSAAITAETISQVKQEQARRTAEANGPCPKCADKGYLKPELFRAEWCSCQAATAQKERTPNLIESMNWLSALPRATAEAKAAA